MDDAASGGLVGEFGETVNFGFDAWRVAVGGDGGFNFAGGNTLAKLLHSDFSAVDDNRVTGA